MSIHKDGLMAHIVEQTMRQHTNKEIQLSDFLNTLDDQSKTNTQIQNNQENLYRMLI